MKIHLDLTDAERLVSSLAMSVTDSVAEANADPERMLVCLAEASAFAHTQARLCDRLYDAAAAVTPVTVDEEASATDLRSAIAAKNVTPIRAKVLGPAAVGVFGRPGPDSAA